MFSLSALHLSTIIRVGRQDRILSGRVEKQIVINLLHKDIHSMKSSIQSLLRSGNWNYFQRYAADAAAFETKIEALQEYGNSREMTYALDDASAMFTTFSFRVNSLVERYQEGVESIYLRPKEAEMLRYASYIDDQLDLLNTLFLDDLNGFMDHFGKEMQSNRNVALLLLILFLSLCYLLSIQFTHSISQPIHLLAVALKQFGANKQVDFVRPRTRSKEIVTLYEAFGQMAGEICSQIQSIEEKSVIEQKLKDQEIDHHRTVHLLKESELAFLQSQINPHFMFNTLNVVAALADIEDAPGTVEMVKSFSGLLRYNLVKQDRDVTFGQELELVRHYVHIQKVRFGEKVAFMESCAEETLDVMVPALLLQPLVENAIKHGIEPIAQQGTITLASWLEDGFLSILLSDDGKGIDAQLAKAIMDGTDRGSSIGVKNVMRRLELRYSRKCFEIAPNDNSGTVCRIRIPLHKV